LDLAVHEASSLLPARRDGVEVDEGVHAVQRRPVVAELELGDARGRRVERPDAVEPEAEGLEDQDADGNAVSDQADGLVLVARAKPLESRQHALARLGEALTRGRRYEMRRAGPPLIDHRVARPRLVEREPFPLSEAELLEGRVRLDLEAVKGGDGLGRLARPAKRARVDRGEGGVLQFARGGFGLDEAFG